MSVSAIVGDVLSEEQLQKIWHETTDEGASPLTVGPRPFIH
jgi:hypothetical protein